MADAADSVTIAASVVMCSSTRSIMTDSQKARRVSVQRRSPLYVNYDPHPLDRLNKQFTRIIYHVR